jgi:hypothetical protein
MKGFVLGVLVTALVGGVLMHLWSRYETVDACLAVDRGLTAAVTRSLRADVQRNLGPQLPGDLTDMVFQPLTEPLIQEQVKAWVADRSWFGCAWTVARLDFGDAGDLIAELRSLTLHF